MAEFGLNLNTIPPQPPTQETQVETTNTENPVVENPQETKPTETQAQTSEQVQETKPDLFFEDFNKRFSTQFKADEELKAVLDAPKKISEYEKRLSDYEATKKSIDDYKKKIEDLEGRDEDPLKWFSSPDAFIAEQLKKKYPKSNPDTLHKIATTDLSKMDDLDVLVKDKQLFVPDAPKESVIRSVVLKKYGIDPTTNPEEWDEIAVAEMKLDAAAARDKINNLKGVIEMPKILTKEEKQAMEAEASSKREQALVPHRDNFSKFDKFTREGVLDYDVPDEFKRKLPDMFNGFFKDAGVEPTEENIQSLKDLRDALLVLEYLPQIKEIIAKEAKTKLEAKVDEQLNNTQPPNTTTLTDHQDVKTLPGLQGLFNSMR